MIWHWSGRSRKKLNKGRLKLRRPLFEGGGVGVSTCLLDGGMFSCPKAAEHCADAAGIHFVVSTHSRPKAAEAFSESLCCYGVKAPLSLGSPQKAEKEYNTGVIILLWMCSVQIFKELFKFAKRTGF